MWSNVMKTFILGEETEFIYPKEKIRTMRELTEEEVTTKTTSQYSNYSKTQNYFLTNC